MLELYHQGSSVSAAKVRFALAEKGLEPGSLADIGFTPYVNLGSTVGYGGALGRWKAARGRLVPAYQTASDVTSRPCWSGVRLILQGIS